MFVWPGVVVVGDAVDLRLVLAVLLPLGGRASRLRPIAVAGGAAAADSPDVGLPGVRVRIDSLFVSVPSLDLGDIHDELLSGFPHADAG